MANSTRFLSAYNKIDKILRSRFDIRPGVSFTECVRKSAAFSAVVRKYEDELLDYSRLRNAIVHNSDDRMVIAEPHTNVVERIELIMQALLSPPLALDSAHKPVLLRYDTPLVKAVKTMAQGGFSNVPVMKDGTLIGVVTNKLIVEFIAKRLGGGDLSRAVQNVTVSETLSGYNEHYMLMPSSASVDSVLAAFYEKPKLQIVLLTRGGRADEDIGGVLTTGDILKLNEKLILW